MEKKQEMLQTGRLILKGFDERDREPMVDLFFREEIKRTYMLPDFESREQAGKLFERMMVLSRSEDRFVYGIYWGQTLVGFVNDCEIKDATIEIGYVIVPEYQGRGIGRLLVEELLKFVNDNGVPGTEIFVELCAVPDKIPFYEKFGFSANEAQRLKIMHPVK